MAGATNRALKSAGIPKSTIQTLRVEHGSGLSLRSALGIAHERGLPVGTAHEFMAKRDAKAAKRPEAQQAAADFRAKAAERMKAVAEHKERRQKNLARAVDAALQTTLTRRHMTKLEARQNAAQAAPKWTPKKRFNNPENAQRMASMLHAGTAAVRAAGTPEKGMVHVYNPESGKVATLKALSTKGGAVVVRDRVRQAEHMPAQYQVIHKGTGIGIGNYHRTRADAAEAAAGMSKNLDKTIERMKSGDVRAGDALHKYVVQKHGRLISRPTPQEVRAEAKAKAKEAAAAKVAERMAQWQKPDKRESRRLGVAQRLTRMYSKARAEANKAGWDAYHAQVDAKTEAAKQAENRADRATARMRHIENRAKKLGVDPKRTYKTKYDLW